MNGEEDLDLIFRFFPGLNELQKNQLTLLGPLYAAWNEKINVISRKDIQSLYQKHVLHSLAIGMWTRFAPGSSILDLGTGGGFPGIPLAILFPETSFFLIDARRKKIKVVQEIAAEIGLRNVKASHIRVEELNEKFDFVLCRAVAEMDRLIQWVRPLISGHSGNALPNGLICLKGGDLKEELSRVRKRHHVEQIEIFDLLPLPVFKEKHIVYVEMM